MISNKKILICITGKNGSGKSTIADYLESEYGFSSYAFADMLNDVYENITGHHFSSLPRKTKDKERQQVIDLANSIKSIFGDNVFAKKVVNSIVFDFYNIVLIPDLRFQIEIDEIKRLEDSHHIFILNINKQLDLDFSNLECFQIVIKNTETIDKLYNNIEDALNIIRLVDNNKLLIKQND